ncbi:MAG: phenylalanine--tRNA ligase subunit beta [Opitutaceae bacterium]|nr:phenylalanine--tRNA ligase subunit beta [Opitutaceae bacterium]
MKLSLNWLKSYVALDAPIDEITHAITFLGFEVEQVIRTGVPPLQHVVVGEVLAREQHPNADKLTVCTVDVGPAGGVKTIVCGAPNHRVGDRVPVALPGAVLPGDFKIKQSKIRGQLSDGMMCAPDELGLGGGHEGLLILDGRPPLGAPINEVLPPGDVVFDVEITPNRPDGLSHLGMARELAAWFRRDLVYPPVKFAGLPAGAPERRDLLGGISVEADEDCPLYTAHVISGVKIGPSPAWLQERLTAVGLRPINNVVDVGNYVMLETGQPVHAFDAKKIGGGRIVVRHARQGEKLVTLDGKDRVLSGRMLVIADAAKPLVIAGIMGGANAEVNDTTTDLVLEVAYFKPACIRWTSRQLGLSTDSSYRYERGVDPHTLREDAHRAIDLILETAGGQVVGPFCQAGEDRPWQSEIRLTPDYVRRQLGFHIPDQEMKDALEALELPIVRDELMSDGQPQWTVSIPSWRGDLDRPIDLVEEILRLYGTDRIPRSTVTAPGLLGDDAPVVVFNRKAADYLVGQHFHECVNYTLRSLAEVGPWVSAASAQELALANPFVEDQSHLRSTLLIGLLESLKLNQSRGTGATRLFEIGRVFIESTGQIYECAAAAFIEAQTKDAGRQWLKRPPADFYTAKNRVHILASHAGVNLAALTAAPVAGGWFGWQEGHSAAIGGLRDHGFEARFGLMNLALVRALGIEGQVMAGIFAILPEKLAAAGGPRRYQEFSHYPPVLRDLALVVDAAAPAEDVRQALARAAQTVAGSAFAVERVAVFDVYQGQGLPEGKKSLAFSLVFRAADRTLTDDEVNTAFAGIQKAITADGRMSVRS